MTIPLKALRIIKLLKKAGARDVLIVGGFVRDSLLGIQSKDIDIEVYGLTIDQIIMTLSLNSLSVDIVGKAFGVVKIDNEIDVSVPRRENKIGTGHRDFEMLPDPNMSIEEAASRRDFTINSMAMREDGTILDPFRGQDAIRDKALRATSVITFVEDPLRVLRAMQFAGRFSFGLDLFTIDACKQMSNEFFFLPRERIWEEWKKLALKGVDASRGLNTLVHTEWIKHFPELNALLNVPQDPEWHPEGDVWVHTIMVVQEAINIANREQLDEESRLVLFFAALCHDLGKPDTTKMEGGRWRAKGHCEEGATHAMNFLSRIGAPAWLMQKVKPLVVEHLIHAGNQPTERAVRRLANRLHPTNINMLSLLIESDHSGRTPLPKGNPFLSWVEMANRMELTNAKPLPILRGRDLIQLGHEPGKEMGKLLDQAFEAQLNGEFSDLDGSVKWVIRHLGWSSV